MSERIRYAEVVTPNDTTYWAYKDLSVLTRDIRKMYEDHKIVPTIRLGISKDVVYQTEYWKHFKRSSKKMPFRNNEAVNLGSLVEQ